MSHPVNASAHPQKKRGLGFLNKLLLALLAIAVIVAIVALLLPKLVPSLYESGERTITSNTIKNSFESIAELSVEEYNFTNIGKFNEDNSEILGIGVPLTGKNFLITYDGTVKAGIRDINKVDVDVDDSTRTITVDIPDTEVLESSIDPNSIEQYDQSFNPLNQLEVKDTAEFLSSEESKAEQTAVDSGLLDRAENRSRELFTQQVQALAKGSNLEDYKIEVK
ncbi:DUF4230 domain-containing protein [uncultured Corynebacterium sp.]|uniref:DUF4230 domain-containing protein n=1 Tax=uncultured Corynebacterium sp. TaxID=159447 RepID=UPI00259ACB49|nr:DUF4230 domain-containing protein [uncultured Corynebacterium sp.]